MKRFFLLALVALAPGCGARPEAGVLPNEVLANDAPVVKQGAVRPRTEVPVDCPLRVDFGSYAMGIDRGAADAARELLAGDPGVVSVENYPWGREGETTMCVVTRSAGDAERLFHAISRLFPANPRGPLSVSTAAGLRFDAPRR